MVDKVTQANKKLREKLDQYEKAFKNLTMEDMAESASRMYKMEFDQENPIKPKKKPKTVLLGLIFGISFFSPNNEPKIYENVSKLIIKIIK